MEINVLIDEEFEEKVDAAWLEGIALRALAAELRKRLGDARPRQRDGR